MKVLHYTLGLPPKRSGGLTRYALDIMNEETCEHEVFHLFPGNIDILNRKTRIKKSKNVVGRIKNYELINSLPLPLFNGIKEPNDFIKNGPMNVYIDFFEQIKPDIIHVHTLMGIHKEFFLAAKNLGIKMVFTTHDYFGICPKISLFKEGENINCESYDNGRGCVGCCINAVGTSSLLITQTPIYPALKKLKSFKKSSSATTHNQVEPVHIKSDENAYKFVELRNFYLSIFKEIDFFHFNSTLTENVYRKYLPNVKGKVIGITHSKIQEKEIGNKSKSDKIRLGYIGPFKEYKGLFLLLDVMKKISHNKYELHLYGDNSQLEIQDNVVLHGRYNADDLKEIFEEIDVLLVPSLWRETFGFTVLEALSYGTPVIVSDKVGSKDLVAPDFGWIFNSQSKQELLNLLNNMHYEEVIRKQKNLNCNFEKQNMRFHTLRIIREVYAPYILKS